MSKQLERCPTCGSVIRHRTYKKQIAQLRLSFSQKTLDMIDEVIRLIDSNYYRKMDAVDQYAFYIAVKEIQEIVIRKCIRLYVDKRLYESGYALKYLTGIIKNENASFALRKEKEKHELDRLPPSFD